MWWWLVVVGLALARLAEAGLYEDAKQTIHVDVVPQRDHSGVSVRGGMSLKTGEKAHSATLFRAQAHSGSSCSAFDFRGSMKAAFEEFPEMLEALVKEIVGQLPLLAACYASPTICDLYKHYQGLMNALIQAKYGHCQAIQNAMMYAGKRLAGGEESNCLAVMQGRGFPIHKALQISFGECICNSRTKGSLPSIAVNAVWCRGFTE